MTKRWLFLFVMVISVMLFASATGEMDEFEFFEMELVSFDANDSWDWGSAHSLTSYSWTYAGVDDETADQIEDYQEQWQKILFRLEFTMKPQAPDDYYDVIRITDFRINNCQDIQIYPHYSYLSGAECCFIDIDAEELKQKPCCICLEAIAKREAAGKGDLISRIQSADLVCNIEFQPETSFRYKRVLSINTNKAVQEKRYIDGGIKAYVKEISPIDPSRLPVTDVLVDAGSDDWQPVDLTDKTAYKVVIGFEKQMPYDVFCLEIGTNSPWIQLLPADEIGNINRDDTRQNGRETEMETILVCDNHNMPEQSPESLLPYLFLEFSTEYFGENELNGTPANGVYGIRFREPLKYN